MKLYYGLQDLPASFSAGAVAIGNFDGVHRGHAQIVRCLRTRAAQCQGPAVVFTFEPHPVRLLRPEAAPPPLTWVDRKVELLATLDVDIVIAYPTDQALLSLGPDEYFDQIVCQQLRARAVVEGPNFHFGKNRVGDINLLAALCRERGLALDVVEPLLLDDDFISSSRVREAISRGQIDVANAMLTQPYRIRGMVTHGAGRGATLGFPTANVSAVDTLLPGVGVYAGGARVKDRVWPAAIHIGSNPTFGEDRVKLEVHLIGFVGLLYGEPLEVDFLTRLRDIHPFNSPQQLKQQLGLDVESARLKFAAANPS